MLGRIQDGVETQDGVHTHEGGYGTCTAGGPPLLSIRSAPGSE